MAETPPPTGLALVDGLARLDSPTIDDYCRAAAEYIRMASNVGSGSGKEAQIRLSQALAVVAVRDLRRRPEQESSTRSLPSARLVVACEA